MKIHVLLIAALALLTTSRGALAADAVASSARGGATEKPAPQAAKPELPKEKQTTLGLYLTAKEAYDKWKADPDKVKILDVRTSEEYLFVGHPAMAWNIPLMLQTYQWDAEQAEAPHEAQPGFRLPGEGGCQAHRHDLGHVPVRGAQCAGSQPTCRGWIPERLQHHRWHGGRCGG